MHKRQVSAAALRGGGAGSLLSTQKEQEEAAAVSRGARTFPHKIQGCDFFFFFTLGGKNSQPVGMFLIEDKQQIRVNVILTSQQDPGREQFLDSENVGV